MNELVKRALTGGLFVAVILSAFWLGTVATFFLFLMITWIGLDEYAKLFSDNQQVFLSPTLVKWGGVCLFVSLALPYFLYAQHWIDIKNFKPGAILFTNTLIPYILVSILLPIELYRKKNTPIPNIGTTILGWLYLAVPFSLVIQISFHEEGFFLLTGLFLIVWMNDTFAYLTGRVIGKTKLFERISPKKTWEGTIGGIFFSILTALIYAYFTEMSYLFFILAAPIIATASIFGDLFESLLKRSVGIKDSGTLLPGHGGILDRFDAVIFAIPFFYVWWKIFTLILN